MEPSNPKSTPEVDLARREALAKLGKLALLTSPVMLGLVTNRRASAASGAEPAPIGE